MIAIGQNRTRQSAFHSLNNLPRRLLQSFAELGCGSVQEIDTPKLQAWFYRKGRVKVATAAAYLFGIQHFLAWYRRAEACRQQCSQSTHSRRTEEIHDQQRTPKIDGGSLDEIKADPELINEVRDAVLKYASPEELREFASKLRVAGNAEAAYDLEELADQREGR